MELQEGGVFIGLALMGLAKMPLKGLSSVCETQWNCAVSTYSVIVCRDTHKHTSHAAILAVLISE